jgi:hypothetical protein
MQLAPGILAAYTTIIPASIFWGILLSTIVIGMWARNRSVRLVSVTFIILSPLLMTSGVGVSWGVPLALQSIGQGLLAAGLAGLLLSFVKR